MGGAIRILVTGSRDWHSEGLVWHQLDFFGKGESVTVVHGACPSGADLFAHHWCEQMQVFTDYMGIVVTEERHPAKWRVEGKYDGRAGFKRNAEMVALGADICLAFIENKSRGATHTADLAERSGIVTIRYT